MTQLKQSLVWICTLLLLAAGCQDDEPFVAPIDQLPPATQTGAYTFGCLVNGEAFVPENSRDITAIYQKGILQMGGGVQIADVSHGMVLNLREEVIRQQTYVLIPSFERGVRYVDSSNLTLDSAGNNYIGNCEYEYENLIEGTLTITHFDDENYIVSGTFEFTTATEGCDTIRVTDGRFDIPYIP